MAGVSSQDVTEAILRLIKRDGMMLADGGPWVRFAPTAPTEAVPGGRPSGPLDGMIVAVKDIVAVAGLPTLAGSLTRAESPPVERDAAVVAALRQAGAVVAGTVAVHELAFGVTGVNHRVGFPRHPTHPECIPGGSSSGSAVAVGLHACDLAVGTDTGGSVRIPAALCGVTGFKPSRGRYPMDGVLPLAPTLDNLGFLAERPDTVALAHRVMTHEAVQPRVPSRVGVDRDALEAASGPVQAAVDGTLRELRDAGCHLVDVRWPDVAQATPVMEMSTTILFAEAAATYHDLLGSSALQMIGADVANRLETGAAIGDDKLQAARAEQARIEDAVRAMLGTVDVVAGPTVPVVAPTVEAARDDASLPQTLVSNTRLANVTGVPALSLPVLRPNGPPAGFQLMAASDEQVLSYGIGIAHAASSLRVP
jgi:aspartyl-tRNA(Asn)/glutamyl-tRNA(Gln) amidotransferase subunit A